MGFCVQQRRVLGAVCCCLQEQVWTRLPGLIWCHSSVCQKTNDWVFTLNLWVKERLNSSLAAPETGKHWLCRRMTNGLADLQDVIRCFIIQYFMVYTLNAKPVVYVERWKGSSPLKKQQISLKSVFFCSGLFWPKLPQETTDYFWSVFHQTSICANKLSQRHTHAGTRRRAGQRPLLAMWCIAERFHDHVNRFCVMNLTQKKKGFIRLESMMWHSGRCRELISRGASILLLNLPP